MAKNNLRSIRTLVVLALTMLSVTACRANELSLGNASTVESEIDIPINKLESFNYLTKAEILALRTAQVKKVADTANVLAKQYEPSMPIFSMIVDKKPWWGMHGSFVYGSGQRSIEGPAEESRFVMNPFLLVGLSSWSAEIWDQERVSAEDLNAPDFPFCWNPTSLKFAPKKNLMMETYDVSSFNKAIERRDSKIKDKAPIVDFGLIAYNARDFGFNHIYVPIDQCENIVNVNETNEACEIKQFIHCGGTCGYPEDCNNMSPAQKPIDHFKYTKLPAHLKVLLWKGKPATLQTAPDMTVSITLE